MSTETADAVTIIRGLKLHFGADSDEALADRLGVAKSTIASWRRRGGLPRRTIKEIETRYGLTIAVITNDTQEKYRDYVLCYAFHVITMRLAKSYFSTIEGSDQIYSLAENLAAIDPYLKRAIVKASSVDRYRGVDGAASFLMDLRNERINSGDLVEEARAERARELGI